MSSDRTGQWLVLGGAVAIVSISSGYIMAATGNKNGFAYGVLATIIGTAAVVIVLGYLLWGWCLTLDADLGECVLRRTYAWLPYRTLRVSLADGPVGPCSVHLTWTEDRASIGSALGCLLLTLLGPFGLILGLVLGASGRSSKHVESRDFPGVFHYNELTDVATLLLVLETEPDRERVLNALAEHVPQQISTS